MLRVKNRSIFLFGYYGRNNIGDEIMLSNLLEIFDKNGANNIYVVSSTSIVPLVKLEHSKLKVLNGIKKNPILFLWALLSANLFVWGGGTCFFERDNKRGLWEIYIMLTLRKLVFNTKNYFLGIGLEPLGESKRLIERILRKSRGVVYRDLISLQLHNQYFSNIDLDFLEMFDDLVIHKNTLDQVNKKIQVEGPPYLTFSGHFKYDDIMAKHVANQLVILAKKSQLSVVFLPAKFGDKESDETFHRMVEKEMISSGKGDFVQHVKISNNEDFCSYLSQSSLHVGMRLHSLILADIFGIPNIAIAYQNKIYQYNPEAMEPTSDWGLNTPSQSDTVGMKNRMEQNTMNYEGFIA